VLGVFLSEGQLLPYNYHMHATLKSYNRLLDVVYNFAMSNNIIGQNVLIIIKVLRKQQTEDDTNRTIQPSNDNDDNDDNCMISYKCTNDW